jgi:tetratricopeptide (TPR) repeat protein
MVLTRGQIEENLRGKGEFVKIDHLNRFLREADSLDIKKFILTKLASIYEEKGFLSDAARNYDAAADIVTTFKEKIDFYMKEAELYVKIGKFEVADQAFQKAYASGNSKDKIECQEKYRKLYYIEAEKHEKAMMMRKAAEIYEKIYSMPQPEDQRAKAKNKLLDLYNRLGKIRDYNRLASKVESKPEEKPKIVPGSFEDLGIRKY